MSFRPGTQKAMIVDILHYHKYNYGKPMSLRELSTEMFLRTHQYLIKDSSDVRKTSNLDYNIEGSMTPAELREYAYRGGHSITGEKEGYTEIAAGITGTGPLGQLVKQGIVKKVGRGLYELDEPEFQRREGLAKLYEHYAVDRNP